MPATSRSQRRAMAIAEHHPEQVYPENRGMLNMSKSQLHDFASTPEKGLPERKKKTSPKPRVRMVDNKIKRTKIK